jgi:Glycosyl transferases group 1/Glycosyltransferase Family 4
MRVLQVDAGRTMGGGQWQVLRLVRGLQAAGIETLLLARAGAPLFERAKSEGLAVEAFSRVRLGRGFDLMHVHDAHSHTWAALTGCPLIVSRRVAFPLKTSWLSRWKYSRARHFIAVSQHVAAQLRAGGIDASKISVVYDGVPLLPCVAEANTAVLSAGKLTALARESWPEVRPVHNLEEDLYSAAAMLYLSQSEGLGSAVLLAMSRGVPVVASDLPAIREVIDPGVNGMLVPNEAGAIHAALQQLVDDGALWRRLAQAARATVEQRFTESRMVDQTLQVYREQLHA